MFSLASSNSHCQHGFLAFVASSPSYVIRLTEQAVLHLHSICIVVLLACTISVISNSCLKLQVATCTAYADKPFCM